MRRRQVLKAFMQNYKIRLVPYWKREWYDKNPTSAGYESCMEAYEEMEEMKWWERQSINCCLK